MALRGLKKLVGATCITLLAIGPSLGQGLHDHSRFHTTSQSINVGVGGDGDIRAQLSWQNQSDLDLHMTQPDHGVHVYYGRSSVTFNNGGATAQLDHDNRGGRIDVGPDKRVENIVVTGESIPHGQYNFYVNNFRGGHSPYEIVIKGNNDGRIIVNNGVVNYSGENSPYYTINFDGTTVSQEIPNIPLDSIGSSSDNHNSDLHIYERQNNSPTYQNQGSGQNLSWNSGITTQPGQLYRDGNKYSFEPFIRQLVNTYDQFDQGNYNLGEIAGNISNLMKWDDIKFIGWDGLGDREYIIQHKDSRSPSGVVNYHMNVSLNRGGESLNSYSTSMGVNVEGIGLPPINPQENIVVAANSVLPKIPNSPLAPEKPINVNTPISIITGLPANIVDSKSYESLNQNYNSVVSDYSNQNDLSDYDMLSNYLVDNVANCSSELDCFKANIELTKFSIYSSPIQVANYVREKVENPGREIEVNDYGNVKSFNLTEDARVVDKVTMGVLVVGGVLSQPIDNPDPYATAVADNIQITLDAGSFVPVFGAVPDATNAAFSGARGALNVALGDSERASEHFISGGLSTLGLVTAGVSGGQLKVAKEAGEQLAKRSDDALDVIKKPDIVTGNQYIPIDQLNSRFVAEEIASGHAFSKHVLSNGEFSGLGIRTRQQFADHIESVVNNPDTVRYTTDGRVFYVQKSTGTFVVRNASGSGEGTAYQPSNWDLEYSKLPNRTEPY